MSLPISATRSVPEVVPSLRQHWWVFLILGLVLIVVGFLALSAMFVATMASVLVFGVLLLIAGGTEIVHALMVRKFGGFAIHLLFAALYLFAGVFMLEDPVRAAAVITLVLAAAFFVGGLLRIIVAVVERFHAWPWVLFNGVVDLVLGVLIWQGWPESSWWVIGLFVGIDLLLHGWSWVFLGLTVRTMTSPLPQAG
jgi:uncharacterized membrane protein HdeD (DUF308 family)